MNWLFKPTINGMDIIIVFLVSELLMDLTGAWGIVLLFPYFILSSTIQDHLWKVSKQ